MVELGVGVKKAEMQSSISENGGGASAGIGAGIADSGGRKNGLVR